jgi:Zn-dependent protease with chaperone function
MDFFARQQRVRSTSTRLVLLFVAAVIGIVLAVDLAVLAAFNAFSASGGEQIGLIVVASLATLAAIGVAALYRTVALRGGGGTVARELGGIPVPRDTTDPQLRRLRNVVEEIAIASGVTVPEVYVLPEEDAINAFAAGWSTSDAAVAVTRGALERLNRDELQGVIAHEFSHVVNGDMRLNIRLMGLLFGILFLSVIGRILLQASIFSSGRGRGRSSNQNPLPLIGIALLVTGFIGVIAGRLIKASVSRQREYLADASAVQFTRQTSGIVGALKKIAGLPTGSKLRNPRTEEVGHMLFGSGLRLSSWFATHPPLPDRIRVLDPSFDPAELEALARQWAVEPPSGLAEDAAAGPVGAGVGALPLATAGEPVDPRSVAAQVAAPSDAAYRRAGAILDEIGEDILTRARGVDTVVPLVLGLLLADDPAARAAQHGVIAQRYGRPLADAAAAEADTLARLHPLLRLPLAELSFPALRERAQLDREAVLGTVFALIHVDGRISPFEYCLSRLLHRELHESFDPRRPRRTSFDASTPAVATLLSVLAEAGHVDQAGAERAFAAGMRRVLRGRPPVPYLVPERGVVELETVWDTLDGLGPADKALLVQAAVDAISQDGVLTVTELELLRTVCALLHCPLPPHLDATRS